MARFENRFEGRGPETARRVRREGKNTYPLCRRRGGTGQVLPGRRHEPGPKRGGGGAKHVARANKSERESGRALVGGNELGTGSVDR